MAFEWLDSMLVECGLLQYLWFFGCSVCVYLFYLSVIEFFAAITKQLLNVVIISDKYCNAYLRAARSIAMYICTYVFRCACAMFLFASKATINYVYV